MQYDFYGLGRVLDSARYYNALFEADVPRPLLDAVARASEFNAVPLALALYEGTAVAEVRGSRQPSEADIQVGVNYLLCFMAVALHVYDQMPWDRRSIFQEAATDLTNSLKSDGLNYTGGVILDMRTGELVRPVPLEPNAPRPIVTSTAATTSRAQNGNATGPTVKSRPTATVQPPPTTQPVRISSSARRDAGRAAVILGILTVVVTFVVGIFNVEVHSWLINLWHRWFR
jgi:hypothetical protein